MMKFLFHHYNNRMTTPLFMEWFFLYIFIYFKLIIILILIINKITIFFITIIDNYILIIEFKIT